MRAVNGCHASLICYCNDQPFYQPGSCSNGRYVDRILHVSVNSAPPDERNKENTLTNRIVKLLVLALLATFAILPSTLRTQVALADSGGERGHNFDITFTKWITTFPNMEGIVGGDVGVGTFAGEILTFLPGLHITNIEALYHMNGGNHFFSAHVFVTENEDTGKATITGVVTDGWHKGKDVLGEYTIISCPDKTLGLCFQGTLHIHVGSE